jgi:hypothetical protein
MVHAARYGSCFLQALPAAELRRVPLVATRRLQVRHGASKQSNAVIAADVRACIPLRVLAALLNCVKLLLPVCLS